MMKNFIMESLCLYAKKRFFARIFDMYFHIIISGEMVQEERERVFIKERDKEAKKREREREITILNSQ